eukprot:223029-Chlamydomonas_euryale.AAC.2
MYAPRRGGGGGQPARAHLPELCLPVPFLFCRAGTGIVVYSWTHPDKEGLVPSRLPPELQYLASRGQPNEEPVANWSATHEVTPA